MKTLAEQIAELQDPAPPKELDPESQDVFASHGDSASEVEDDQDEFDGREHYEVVGESRLRKPSQPKLGKQYEGTSVSRNALNGDDYENESHDDESEGPDESDNIDDVDEDIDLDVLGNEIDDSEIDSEEAFGSGDEERFKDFSFSGSRQRREKEGNDLQGSEDDSDGERDDVQYSGLEDDLESEGSEEDEDVDMEDDLEEDEELDDETDATSEDEEGPLKPAASSDRATLRALMSADTKAVASSISAAAEADAQKGRAVKEQYQTFDKLIDLRIKLQKGFTAANEIPDNADQSDVSTDAVRKAEEAALQLWSTLESLRHDFLDTQESPTTTITTKKRKRPSPASSTTPTSTLWSRTQTLESQSLPHRRAILNKWSTRIRASTASAATSDSRSRLLDSSSTNNNITSILDAYISTHPPTPPHTSSLTYDDTPFYQSLLLALINSRQTSSATTTSSVILPTPTRAPKHHRPNLDTKASKGRKMRYTVHEKMMNFTAPETHTGSGGGDGDVRRWGDVQIDEFFGSLFGGRRVLDEHEVDGMDGDGVEEGAEEEEGLRLFR